MVELGERKARRDECLDLSQPDERMSEYGTSAFDRPVLLPSMSKAKRAKIDQQAEYANQIGQKSMDSERMDGDTRTDIENR